MKRLFVAIKVHPSEELLNAYDTIKTRLSGGKINWVHKNNFHITLKFLGDTPDKQIPGIIDSLNQAATQTQIIHFTVENFGFFGSVSFPRVLWMGINQQNQGIEKAFVQTQKALEKTGKIKEELIFKPHLTLGRIKHIDNITPLHELEAEFKGKLFQEVTVDSIELYQSNLKPKGPVYKVIEKFNLQ